MGRYLLLLYTILLVACARTVASVPIPRATVVMPTAIVLTPTVLPTKTLQPYEQYTIDYLRQRTYGGGKIEVLKKLSETDLFTTYSIRYPSEGLTIYGFVNIPKGPGPFPVIVSIHGYAPYGRYDVFKPTQDSADYFAANQFIVVHPGLRNQPPSDNGDNLLRVGMSLDVMNLIALLKQRNDLPAELADADMDRLGMWGTSMGGEIALRVMTISPDIKATVLFSPLSGNIDRNSKQLYDVIRDEQFQLDAQVPLGLMDRISPAYYYYRITSAVQLHHGTADTTAPMSWAAETCDFLKSAGASVECFYYKGADHAFGGENGKNMRESALDFYRAYLAP